jgi:pimeloyl-ACP methyl ester carboxylesterase
LIHGMGGHWQHWLETIPFLAQRGRVLAVDLPGFGRSEPLANGVSLDGLADTTAALCRAVGLERWSFSAIRWAARSRCASPPDMPI